MKTSFAVAACSLLLVSPCLAQSHHKARIRHSAERGTVVTAGSSVRITDIGEVIGPSNNTIIVVSSQPPPDRGRLGARPKGSTGQP